MPLPVRWRYKLDRWRRDIATKFRSQPAQAPRPRLCPACGTLVGATATKCHQCGASMTFSLAAASRSLSRVMPQSGPVTYAILGLSCVLYAVGLLATMRRSGFAAPGGGLGMLFGLGGISGFILDRMGASLPLVLNLEQPWRLITAMFLHGSLLHIGFNMWILMDIGPMIEEMYGSARFFFMYVITGLCGFLASSLSGNASVGASGAVLGLVGVLLALTSGRQNPGMRMMRSQLISWLIYIAVLGFLMRGMVDNYAHAGGLAAGFALGKLMAGRQPADTIERRRADALGWAAGLMVAASFFFMLLNYFGTSQPPG
jgi:rhomboid protease GluP